MATILDFDIDTGGEYIARLTWYDETATRVDLSAGGYAAKLTIRDPNGNVLLTITDSDIASRIDLEVDATQNDDYGEVAPDTTGVVTVRIYASDTAPMSGLSGVYDLIMTPSTGADHAFKLVKGAVNLDTLVTT